MVKCMYKKIKYGFTLAEVLITLGVIGVVAAITIPNVVYQYKKSVIEKKLMRIYSNVSNALNRSISEYGDWSQTNVGTSDNLQGIIAKEYIAAYITGAKAYDNGIISRRKLGYSNALGIPHFDSGNKVLLPTGEILSVNWLYDPRTGITGYMIVVDLNGSKKPNALGRDIFFMVWALYNNKLIMNGDRQPNWLGVNYNDKENSYETIYNNCKVNGMNGQFDHCGALIQRNGWKIPDNYPKKF